MNPLGPDRNLSADQAMVSALRDMATQGQRQAADPRASVWVAASAGSGKTKVLTDRVLSLLLSGCAPGRLLCLTFTKAAAAEMANRLSRTLSDWAVASSEKLASDLQGLLDRSPRDREIERARQLFALTLDSPGGMKIQTIHAFCQSLLGRFPLEADIPPQFAVLEERQAQELLEDARLSVLAGQEALPSAATSQALQQVARYAAETTFTELLSNLIRERGRIIRLLQEFGDIDRLCQVTCDRLGLTSGESHESVLHAACQEDAFDGAALRRVADALCQGGKTDRSHGEIMAAWMASPSNRRDMFEGYLKAFFTDGGRGDLYSKLIHKDALAQAPDGEAILMAEADRLQEVRDKLNALAVAEATTALLTVGAAVLQSYQRRKEERALLDYDDLILKARDLLRRPGVAPWVLFKLDGGLDHVLIDEAQDTNPDQWQVIQALTDEFFAGDGAEQGKGAVTGPRTIFAVGDGKQSIFSFQRADPAEFARMQLYFERRVLEAEQGWESVDLGVSFRSTLPVLDLVDRVFAHPQAGDGVVAPDRTLKHHAVRQGQGGLVELWPIALAPQAESIQAWEPPLSRRGDLPARTRLAQYIAQKVAGWIQEAGTSPSGTVDPDGILASKKRPVRAGDILILVRRRDALVDELVRALKALDVPVAGVDRMVLTEQLAVMDLVALGRALLLPEDDLTLASVLKGPLFNLNEEQLFELAHDRPSSLWQALSLAARGDPTASPHRDSYREIFNELSELLNLVDFKRPYDLFVHILGARGGRQKIFRRLGPEAADPIEEFLGLAQSYETQSVASLEGFLHWLELGKTEIKRDLEHGDNLVRIMTVHGSKGLQAPIVILPDTMAEPRERPGLLWLNDQGSLPVWPLNKSYDGPAVARARSAAKQATAQEYRRLLYVAMTRAEDRLYVTGWQGRRQAPVGAWYNLIKQAFTDEDVGIAGPRLETGLTLARMDWSEADDWDGEAWRLEAPQRDREEEEGSLLRDPVLEGTALPAWAETAAPLEPSPPRPLAPSRPLEVEPAVRSPLQWRNDQADDGRRFQRGRLIHRLLQSLPDVPLEQRRQAAERYLATFLGGPEPSKAAKFDSGEIVEEVLAVLNHPDYQALFGPDSRAEVPLVGLGQGGGEGLTADFVVSGQIDRLLVRRDRVVVVDFKTNRPPPRTAEEIPLIYLKQLASYQSVLSAIYPNRPIESYLLWTDVPSLMRVSHEQLTGLAP
ncbi:MAG: double-strand break repair helicase AddA [Pseudomonadota bacterium]